MKIDKLLKRYRIEHGKHFTLKGHDPADTHGLGSELKPQAKELLADGVQELNRLQDILAAQDCWGLLLIFQGMDAAGKDGTIKHVMSGVNPQGVDVWSFKAPSAEELNHDYLWRTTKCLPARGRIGIFNRSYYEEVLVVRVHRALLAAERIPVPRVTRRIWRERFEDINGFERHLWRNGTIIRKFYLHISREEQRRRLLERLENPAKYWKYSPADLQERERWDAYRRAYEDALAATSHRQAPWYVVPADHKWFAQVLVAEIVVQALEALDLSFPRLSASQKRAL